MRPGGYPKGVQARAWVEVDLAALWANYRLLAGRAGGEVIPVLKADAYGHGALPLARFLEGKGVGRFAVATLEEGRRLREGGIKGEVLLLGSLHPLEAEEALRLGLVPTLSNLEAAEALSQRARALGLVPRAHLKVDTGMNRVGFPSEEAVSALRAVEALGVRVEGVYTHLATAGEDAALDAGVFSGEGVLHGRSRDIRGPSRARRGNAKGFCRENIRRGNSSRSAAFRSRRLAAAARAHRHCHLHATAHNSPSAKTARAAQHASDRKRRQWPSASRK